MVLNEQNSVSALKTERVLCVPNHQYKIRNAVTGKEQMKTRNEENLNTDIATIVIL